MRLGFVIITSILSLLFVSYLWITRPEPVSLETYQSLSAIIARPDVKAAIAASNVRKKNIPQLNTQWVQEAKHSEKGVLINELMQTKLSQTLIAVKKNSAHRLDQIMIMDALGALVAADRPTHDYDQSDEPKWLATVGKQNKNAVHEFSENRNGHIFDQLSQSVTDNNGKIIGAVTIVWQR